MKIFLSVAAVLGWLFGAALIFAPGPFYQPAKIALTPLLATLAQAHGATLFGLGVINWLSRSADRQGLSAVLTGNLVAQILSLGVVLRTITLGAARAGHGSRPLDCYSCFAGKPLRVFSIPNEKCTSLKSASRWLVSQTSCGRNGGGSRA